jgi:hypothetical protein
MICPFPGMDPYLEEPARWGGVHSRLINSISDFLADMVAPHFIVDIEERVYITSPDEPARWAVVPDIYVVTKPQAEQQVLAPEQITAPTLVDPVYPVEIRDRYLEIRDTRNQEVITTIEILSPSNKTTGEQMRDAFYRKREAVMRSTTHWIEIDLLRAGERPAEVTGKSDYYALLKRGGEPGPFEVWYFDLRDRLPIIAVPLRPPFPAIALDLQSIFEQVYKRAHYAESVDYTRTPPAPRLPPAERAWLAERIRQWQQA